MKKLLAIVLLGIFLGLAQPASAHVLKTDGAIGGVLHIDPQDDPVAGEPSGFFFELKDKTGKFVPQQCDCTFTVLQNGRELTSQPLYANGQNGSDSTVFYTFPQKGIYQVIASGKPYTEGTFQPFRLAFDIRVERVADQTAANTPSKMAIPHIGHLVLALVAVLFLAIAVGKKLIDRRKNTLTRKEPL